MGAEAGENGSTVQAPPNTDTTTDQGAGSAASTSGDSAATPEIVAPKPSWKDIDFTQVDVKELISSVPALQGVLGNMSQAQAAKIARKMLQEEQARIQAEEQAEALKRGREEKRRLAREDPDKLAEIVQEEVTKEEYQDWQRGIRQSMQQELHGYIQEQVQEVYADPDVQDVMKDADRETLEMLDWRNHPGLASWVKTVNKVVARKQAEKEAEARAEKLYQARSKAAQKESIVEGAKNDATDGVDLGLAGGVPGGRLFTQADLADMLRRGDLSEYRKYKQIIAVQAREGRIK